MFELKGIFYGQSGIGKTTFLSTCLNDERTNRALLIDVDKSTLSIRSKLRPITMKEMGNPEPGKIDCLRIDKWSDFQDIYNYVFGQKLVDRTAAYNFIGVDTLTELHHICLRHVAQNDIQPRLDPEKIEIQDYGEAIRLMEKMLRAFRDLDGCHVFFTAQPRTDTNDSNSVERIVPGMVGQMPDRAVPVLDVVGFMRLAPGQSGQVRKREMIFQPEGKIFAKDRTEGGLLGLKIENPTVKSILDRLEGGQ